MSLNLAIVHPLVLLSVSDHHKRVTRSHNQRVCGILLGTVNRGVVDITNSFAVPFEENPKDPNVWFFDHQFVETMFRMHQKVNIKETIVGWYSTGTSPVPLDLSIHRVVERLVSPNAPAPVYVLVTVTQTKEFPARAFVKVTSSRVPGEQPVDTFDALETRMGQQIAEEIGVEHLLRDIQTFDTSDLTGQRDARINGALALVKQLRAAAKYITDETNPETGRKPKTEIVNMLQEVLYDFPILTNMIKQDLSHLTVEGHLSVLMACIGRSLTALHDVILNRESQLQLESRIRSELEANPVIENVVEEMKQ
ncbi:hypothetical protein RCL1_000580 [Eukaryota sp. TZLM3-RCL]